jgi:hypothetical protein
MCVPCGVNLWMCGCGCVCKHTRACVDVCFLGCEFVDVCIHTRACVDVCFLGCECVDVCMWMCVYIHTRACVFLRTSACSALSSDTKKHRKLPASTQQANPF